MFIPRLLLIGAILTLGACGDDPPAPTPTPTPDPTPDPAPAETVEYTWSQPEVRISTRVPGSLPDGVSTHSMLAMVAHPDGVELFAEGERASRGLRILAETGDPAQLIVEAEAAGSEVMFTDIGALLAVVLSPNPVSEVHHDRPCVTYVQRFTPSDDWFFGVSSFCLVDESGNWLAQASVEMVAYEAGDDAVALLDEPPWFVPPAIVQIQELTLVE